MRLAVDADRTACRVFSVRRYVCDFSEGQACSTGLQGDAPIQTPDFTWVATRGLASREMDAQEDDKMKVGAGTGD